MQENGESMDDSVPVESRPKASARQQVASDQERIRGIPYLSYQQSCLIPYVAMFFHAHRLMYLIH